MPAYARATVEKAEPWKGGSVTGSPYAPTELFIPGGPRPSRC